MDITKKDLAEALKSDTLPTRDDMLPLMWLAIKSIKSDTTTLREDVDCLTVRTKALEEASENRDDDIKQVQAEVQVMKAQMLRYDNQQHQVYKEIEGIKNRSMRDNIIFSFDPDDTNYHEADGEDCGGLVSSFISDIMGVTANIYIQSAHRLGPKNLNKQRSIIARIPNGRHRSIVFNNASRLRGTSHYITNQIPPSQQERRQFVLPEFKSRKADKNNKAVLKQDRLFVRNKLQTQFLPPSLPVISVRPDEASPTIAESSVRKDGGSAFKGYCAGVTSLNDVAAVRQHLITDKPDVAKATHVIYAYRFEGRAGKVTENFESDRDWGTGHELLKAMREHDMVNVICVATRTCSPGFVHIGRKRFSNINELCTQAFNKL